jgi:membrane protein involved in colicin uptake
MPSYKVISKGFFGGHLYDPAGKRRVLHTEKPFPSKDKKEQVPAWLEAIQGETAAQAKARKTAETKAAKARKTAETKAANAAKKEADEQQKDIAEASFLGAGETNSNVETL